MSEKTPWRYFDANLSRIIANPKIAKAMPTLYWIVDSDADMVATTRSERVAKMIVDLVNSQCAMFCKRCGGTGHIEELNKSGGLVGTCPDCGGDGERTPRQRKWVNA